MRKILKHALIAGAALVVIGGCTPQEIDAWLTWNKADPEAAQAYLAQPEVAEDLLLDAAQPDGLAQAERLTPQIQMAPTLPPPPTGLHGMEFAPAGLGDCDEMAFYRVQAGLPDRFQSLGWRESNCRNEDGVHTSCCWGYWQMHRMHFPIEECDAWSVQDVNSDNPLEKQKQACAAKWLYNQVGLSAWGY